MPRTKMIQISFKWKLYFIMTADLHLIVLVVTYEHMQLAGLHEFLFSCPYTPSPLFSPASLEWNKQNLLGKYLNNWKVA